MLIKQGLDKGLIDGGGVLGLNGVFCF